LVVSDSGPVHYLILCGGIEVLPKLYRRLVIPPAVLQELTHPNTPLAISQWIQTPPEWVSVEKPAQDLPSPQIGLGEREAIALALELKADNLLVDDRTARRLASQRGLLTTGTVGVLEEAANRDLLNLRDVLEKLLNTNFRIDAEVVREVLSRASKRQKGRQSGGQA
jgi:predicted nucleic acid-binding protein